MKVHKKEKALQIWAISVSFYWSKKGVDTEEDFYSTMNESLKVYFRPGKELKRAFKATSFEKEQ